MAFYSFPQQVVQEFGKAKVGQLSAAFAYAAIFSIAPVLLILISVVGFVYGQYAAQGELVAKLAGTIGTESAQTLQDVIANTHGSSNGVLALVLGSLGALLAAGGLTSQL